MTSTTVIVPTYKRPVTLAQTIRSLCDQTSKDFDVLVMDNAANEEIRDWVEAFAAGAPILITYVPEPRLGVHYARNAAALRSTSDLLLYTDDDMTFDPKWVAAYQSAFASHPEMAAAAGPVRPVWEVELPRWLEELRGDSREFSMLSLMEPFDEFRLTADGFFYSCNMAIRRDILLARGGFHPEATGNSWIGDGETGLNRDMWKKKDLIGYVPEALNYHHIPATRMTVNYLKKRMANGGASDGFARYRGNVPSRLKLFVHGCRGSIRLAAMWVDARFADGSSRGIEKQLAASRKSASVAYSFRLIYDENLRSLVNRKHWLDDAAPRTERQHVTCGN